MSRRRPVVGAAAWVVVLGVAAVGLKLSGGGALAGPPLGDPGRWSGWLADRDPVVAAFALLRLAALVAVWYLAAVTVAGLLLRLAGAVRMVAVADRFTVPAVRRLLAGTASFGLAASGVMAVGVPWVRVPAAAAQPPTTHSAATQPATTQPAAEPSGTVTMHQLSPEESVPAPVPRSASELAPVDRASDRWTVEPGQCFWSVAESVLTEHLGRAPTDAEIVPYWRRLIEANRSELAHRENPDLVFPGQVFVVPAP